jgi:RNA polymerase sigma factor (sigma-70 family)
MPLTDAELIARTRTGDMSSYDELYRRHVDDARRVARIVTDNSDEADDVVSEAFTRVLDRLQRGGGPDEALTPYLRTVVRRLAIDRYRASRRDGTPADPTLLEVIPESDDHMARATDREMVRQAFDTLPDRWQQVLWHTEIEGRSPASLAASLGSTPNAVAALAYRAREGLRQAYLSVHLSSAVPEECKPYVPKLAAYVRGTLPPAEDRWVAAHLQQCEHCRERRDEVMVLVSDLRGVLWPALLGPVFLAGGGAAVAGAAGASSGAAVLGAAGAASGAAVGAGAAASGSAGTIAAATGSIGGWLARIPKPKTVLGQLGATSASVAATAAIVTGALIVADDDPPVREDFAAAAPAASPEAPAATPTSAATPTPTVTPTPTPTLAPPVTVTPEPSLAETPVDEPVLEPTVEAVAPPPAPDPEPTIEPTTEPTPTPTAKSRRGPPWWLCQRMPWLRPCELRFP